jgi:hypothetical protein
LVRSFQKLPDTVPLLSLERHSPQDAASLPLPLRASTIAIACHRASLASKIELTLTSALLQVLPVAARTDRRGGCAWLYRYCIFLAKSHGMLSVLGSHLFVSHAMLENVHAGSDSVRSGASIGARMRKWRATAAVCGRLRRGGQQQQRSQAQGTIDAGGTVQKQAPLGLIPARHRSAPAAIL